MSNSIWHKQDEKPKDGATIAFYLKDSMGSGDYDYDENEILVNCGFIKFSRITKWATLDDLIAQANKAERLQKAVDVAEEALKYARQRGLDNTATLFAVGTKADKALDEIRQLIKENQ